ncbi:MAG: c-type cytochrome, partial [Pirellulales bacterium]|nr:c-type cytochrome [Pirellulales bacterium]
GAHYEPWRGRESSQYAYERIDTIADHLHFIGTKNVRDGIGSDAEDAAGGGHAHCGTMIYLGNQFPPSYRNQLFTNNIHGRRINNDLLSRSGSGYVASHGADLMRSEDPWFMGVTLANGPSGEIYVSDWSDTGECHSTRNTRRQTGRIYRITYLATHTDPVDLHGLEDGALVELQLDQNDWMVRHARRLLQERASAGMPMAAVHQRLGEMFRQQTKVPKKLRALWALKVTGGLDSAQLERLLQSPHEAIRSWAVTFLCENRRPSNSAGKALFQLATEDPSPKVRLAIASALQRLPLNQRWDLIAALSQHARDSSDQNLPLMYWYAMEPLIGDDLPRYVQLGFAAKLQRLRINFARRVCESDRSARGLQLLTEHLAKTTETFVARDVLTGMLAGLAGRRRVAMPENWPAAFERLQRFGDVSLTDSAIRLALKLGDQNAISVLRSAAADTEQPAQRRNQAIEALVEYREPGFDAALLDLLADEDTRAAAIGGLRQYNHRATGKSILDVYPSLSDKQKQIAMETLSSRPVWANELLDAIQHRTLPSSDLTAYTARQLQALGDKRISARVKELWGDVRDSPHDRARQIERLKKWLTPDVIAQADLAQGKKLFTKHCANCHRFFGQGGKIGPDITGAQRTHLGYLLENIVDPSASVSKDYRMQVFATSDGRVITGLVESENETTVTVLTATDRIVLPAAEIQQRKESEVSIMPAGLLEPLDERAIRDLFGYLQSRAP